MARRYLDEPLQSVLPQLLEERGMSLRQLAEQLGMSVSHLSRSIREVDRAQLTPELVRRLAAALDLPPGLLPEMREAAVIDAVQADPELRDRVYRRLPARHR